LIPRALGRAEAMPDAAEGAGYRTSTDIGSQHMGGADSSEADAGSLPFTDDALRLLAEARGESDSLRHEYIATEHLALALTRRTGGPAAAPLAHLGVDGDQVRQTLATIVRAGTSALAPGAERPYTSRTQKALAFAEESARALGHPRVGTAHVLVGLMRERLNLAAQVLQHHGLTAEAADAHVRRLGADGSPP
jgi:ATP-dependent Clp protease ATP-binding subunit ClpC